ncbi:MAG: 7TM-DISM domain-containing protein [Cyclobacteriaceae bacterium]
MRWTVIVFIFLIYPAFALEAPNYQDTLLLDGPSLAHLSEYSSFWIDRGDEGPDKAGAALNKGEFQNWEMYATLNLGLNPHPLWLHLKIKNISDRKRTYWWSLYSHADSVILYQNINDNWVAIDTSSYSVHARKRSVPVRFLGTSIDLEKGESASLLMKVRNLRRPQHAITDITTPAHNLLWEKKFFWTIGFFIGGLTLLGLFNLVLGSISRDRIFFLLAIYIFIVSVVILQEELLISFYPGPQYFDVLMKLSPIALTLLGGSLHFMVIDYALGENRKNHIRKILGKMNLIGLCYALFYLLIFWLFYDQMTLAFFWYRLSWNAGIVLIILMMVLLFVNIVFAANSRKELLYFMPLASVLFYFSAPGYFLNYEGILPYYPITYPNYFFWILCFEFIAFGVMVGWRYRKTLQKNHTLEQERANHQSQLYERELSAQEKERKQISRDLHDDLGATISAIKLIITNSYKKDEHLVKMVNKASSDLRFFIGNFSVSDLSETDLFEAIEQKITELNDLGRTRFSFIGQGDSTHVGKELELSVYRIISELMNNTLKHSKAKSATLQLIIEDSQLQIICEDNGVGFNTSITYEGMGLDNIHMRTKRHQGSVHTVSDQRSGTTTIITIPLTYEKAH